MHLPQTISIGLILGLLFYTQPSGIYAGWLIICSSFSFDIIYNICFFLSDSRHYSEFIWYCRYHFKCQKQMISKLRYSLHPQWNWLQQQYCIRHSPISVVSIRWSTTTDITLWSLILCLMSHSLNTFDLIGYH